MLSSIRTVVLHPQSLFARFTLPDGKAGGATV